MNTALKEMYEQDQKDREDMHNIDWSAVAERDQVRRTATKKLIDQNQLTEKEDYYHAAMILQHDNDVESYRLANKLAQQSMEMGYEKAKWLYAASLDRLMVYSGEKYQKYGTQFRKEHKDAEWYQYPIDPNTTDEERAKYNVPPLAQLQNRVVELNEGR